MKRRQRSKRCCDSPVSWPGEQEAEMSTWRQRRSRTTSLTRLLLAGLCSLGLLADQTGPVQTLAPSVSAADTSGTVVGFIGSDRLIIQDDEGGSYAVQYIGLRGPVRSSAQHEAAAVFHGQHVLGKRVHLEADGQDEESGYRLRHVF